MAYILCTAEHFAGIMMSSLLLGIVIAKASMPSTKTAFSRVCLITSRCTAAATQEPCQFAKFDMRTATNEQEIGFIVFYGV